MRKIDPNNIADDTFFPVEIPSLTRNGYTRTARTNQDIQELLPLISRRLAEAFASPDDGLPGQRSTEALVFFIRRAIFSDDRTSAENLFRCLINRCRSAFRNAIRGVDEAGREEVQSEVLADIVRLLYCKDDSGDFLQSRFWLYLRRRIVTARRDWLRAASKMLLSADLTQDGDEDEPLEQQIASHDLTPEDQAILTDALGRLPEPLRELVILRYYEGWRVGDESSDAKTGSEPTLAELYKITPRAVRKRLAKALALLTSKEGQ